MCGAGQAGCLCLRDLRRLVCVCVTRIGLAFGNVAFDTRPPRGVTVPNFYIFCIFYVCFDTDKAFMLMGVAGGDGQKMRFVSFLLEVGRKEGRKPVVDGVFRGIVEFVRGFAELEDELVTSNCVRCRVEFEETCADGLRQ